MSEQPTTCTRCGAPLNPSMVFHLLSTEMLSMQPGLECIQCGMVYVNGKWIDMRAEPTEDDDEHMDE